MEAHACIFRHAAGGGEQFGSGIQGGAEFAGQGQLGIGVRDCHAHMQAEIRCVLGFGQNFSEFVVRIEREIAHAVGEIRLADRGA